MGAKSHISKWGTSLAIRIPKAIAEQCGVEEGSPVEIIAQGECILLRKRRYDLDALIAEMSPDRQHPEIDWGRPEGAEVW